MVTIGRKFGDVRVVALVERNKPFRSWLYECKCGRRYAVHEVPLERGDVTACPECEEAERKRGVQKRQRAAGARLMSPQPVAFYYHPTYSH